MSSRVASREISAEPQCLSAIDTVGIQRPSSSFETNFTFRLRSAHGSMAMSAVLW